jgi:hypothetical protein
MRTCRRSSRAGAAAQAGVGWDEDLDAFAGELLHLALVPVAGVGKHDVGIAQTERGQFAPGRADHRLEVPEVR